MKKIIKSVSIALLSLITVLTAVISVSAAPAGRWIASWGTGPTDVSLSGYENIAPILSEITGRTVITSTAGGSKLRIRFTNRYGSLPLTIRAATVAKSACGSTNPDEQTSEIIKDTLVPLTFNGNSSVTIPKGEEIYCDPIDFSVAPMENLSVSYFCRDISEIRTMGLSGGTTFISLSDRNETKTESFGFSIDADEDIKDYVNQLFPSSIDLSLTYKSLRIVPCIASVDVYSAPGAYSVAVVGDSTVANEFPRLLAEKIAASGQSSVGVVGKGIMGNMLLSDGLGLVGKVYGKSLLSRFKSDVLTQAGVDYVVIKIGVNDIVHPVCVDNLEKYPNLVQPTAEELIDGYKQLFSACHKAGKKVIVCSITQWKGNTRDYFGTGDKYVRTAAEFKRDWKIATDVNAWLASSKAHDGYVNLTKISENPIDKAALFPEYTEDGVHPNMKLQQIWADAFPVSLVGSGDKVGCVRFGVSEATVGIGKTKKLNAQVLPANAANKALVWASSDQKIASVDKNGLVTGHKCGTVTIAAKTADGGYKAVCSVKVTIPVSSVALDKSKATVYNTKALSLKAKIAPSNATDKSLKWTTSNKDVASVDKNGKVLGLKAGKAIITCKSADGASARCTVTVLKKTDVKSIKLNAANKGVYKGGTVKLKPVFSPAKATFKDVKWISSDKKVAVVDKNGVVKGVSKGTATITCVSGDNKKAKAVCKVTVKVKTSGVKLPAEASVYETDSKTLKAKVLPANATNKKVTWTSSNTKIATVSKNGVVTGKKPGKAVIKCTTSNGGYTAKCVVTVKKIVRSKSVRLNNYVVNDGTSRKLKPIFSPPNTTLNNCKWAVSDTKIAVIDSNGVLTAKKPGRVTVACKTLDSGRVAKCTVTVKAVIPASVRIVPAAPSVAMGKTCTVNAAVSPSNATNKAVIWKSSDPKVAAVSANGVIKGISVGRATITCTTKSGKRTAAAVVKVTPAKVSSVKLNKTKLTLDFGRSAVLKATVSPSYAGNQRLKWMSSDTSVVKVDSKGKLTAVGKGSATVTCVSADGTKKTAKCVVTVKKTDVLGVKLSTSSKVLTRSGSFKLKATVLPENASCKDVKWTTSNANVATVSADGTVTAKGAGTCTIKATTVDGKWIDTCKVRVL